MLLHCRLQVLASNNYYLVSVLVEDMGSKNPRLMCARRDLLSVFRNNLYHRCDKTGLHGLHVVNLFFPVHVWGTYSGVVDRCAWC